MKKYVPVAAIHTHFNLFRNVHEAHDGPVTIEEQLRAIVRFVRWHERQVVVGKELLTKLLAAQTIIEVATPVPDTIASSSTAIETSQ